MSISSLTEVRSRIERELPANGLTFINTRLILRTGISLTSIGDDENTDADKIRKVLTALAELGYDLHQ